MARGDYDDDYVGSTELIVVSQHGDYRLTKHKNHEDYTVWHRGMVYAQGGRELTRKVFKERTRMDERVEQTIEHDASEVTSQGNQQSAPQQASPAAQGIDIDKRIEQYVRLRDLIKEQDDAHKDKMKPYRDTLEKLNGLLLDHLNKLGGDSVKTKHGTVYKTVRRTVSLEDADAFMRHVIGSEAWELLDRKANSTAVEAFVQENGVLPPGVKQSSITQVGVRRA